MYLTFGADSKTQANTKLTNGFTLYEWVSRKKCSPFFWGRSINGQHKIDLEEVNFLHAHNCKIAPIYDSVKDIHFVTKNGFEDGINAILSAIALGIPPNEQKAIFVKIDPMAQVWDKWIEGFAKTLYNNGYIPGFFANTDSSKNFCFNRSYGRFSIHSKNANAYGSLIWAVEPKAANANVWAPYAPSIIGRENIAIWQNNVNTIEIENCCVNENLIKNKKILNYLW